MRARERKREAIIQALLESGGTIKEAAMMLGMGEATLHRHLADPEFSRAYRKARGQLLDGAVLFLQQAAAEAVQVLRKVMNSDGEAPGPRVAAARTVLAAAIQAQEQMDLLPRIEALEARLLKP